MKYLIMLSLLILSCYANEADRIKTAQKFEQNGFTKEDYNEPKNQDQQIKYFNFTSL